MLDLKYKTYQLCPLLRHGNKGIYSECSEFAFIITIMKIYKALFQLFSQSIL